MPVITLLERQFRTSYILRTAMSGERALDAINEGFIPDVVLTDHAMPGMNGIELCAAVKHLSPETVCVLLSDSTEAKDILKAVDQGILYSYMAKPWESDRLALQVRLAYEHFVLAKQCTQNENSIRDLSRHIGIQNRKIELQTAEIERLNDKVRGHIMESVKLLQGLETSSTSVYYTPHASTVAMMARAIAEELGFSTTRVHQIALAALLHDVGKTGMPERVVQPSADVLSKDDFMYYQHHSERGATLIGTMSGLEEVAEIVFQHHEHYDGTGFPRKLEKSQIMQDAMIVSIADIYHNRVYRLPSSVLMSSTSALKKHHEQSDLETQYRQSQAMAHIMRVSSWFDAAVFKAFNAVAQSGRCLPLQLGTVDESRDVKLVDMLKQKYGSLQKS